MSRQDRWGPEGPPEEAYSRLTNPERFLPLHNAALEMLTALEQRFDVERVEGYDLDEELKIRGLLRPTIALRPTDPEAAPLTVAFTDFPGLSVRFGRWSAELFPICGCDACAEDAEREIERLTERVDILTAGGFREAVVRPWGWWGRNRLETVFERPGGGYSSSGEHLEDDRALEMSGGRRRLDLNWKPWPTR